MTNVTRFPQVNDIPDADTVETLEDALDLAKKGELRSVAIVGATIGNGTFVSYNIPDIIELVGMLSFLQHTMCARQRETRRED